MIPRIIATTQQTRFHVADQRTSTEIHLSGLSISVASPPSHDKVGPADKKKVRGSQELELISNADLNLKAGVCYGLIGRNGSGKSTLLSALGQRIIPGLPKALKIASLQQTDSSQKTNGSSAGNAAARATSTASVLTHVMESDDHKASVAHDLATLSGDTESNDDTALQLRRYRQYKQEKMQEELHELQNEASLRSGQRGARARKDLLSFQEKYDNAKQKIDEDPEDFESADVKATLAESAELISRLQQEMQALSLIDTEVSSRKILRGLGFDDAMMQKPVGALSGGWKMRCQLAVVLRQTADILILDEPTNFLDLLGIIWLQNHLLDVCTEATKTVVLVSHDRAFVDAVCGEIIILRDQSLTYFNGNLTEYEADLRARIKYLTRMQEAQDKTTERLEKTIRANVKQGKAKGDDNKLRMAKSRQTKLENQSGMMVSATGNRFKLSRDRGGFQDTKLAAIEIPTFEAGVLLAVPPATELRHPGPLVSAEKVRLKYVKSSDYTLDGIDLSVRMGDRIGIMGLNGTGKSTFVKVLTGDLKTSGGSVTFHPQVKLGYFSQHMVEKLQRQGSENPTLTAFSLIKEQAGEDLSEQDMMALLGSYGLPGRIATQTPLSSLSGGQCVRLAFCSIIWNAPNLLVLDEVSTHLDSHTVTALADALAAFEGALILVSHDRYLVRRLIEGHRDYDEDDNTDDEEEGASGNTSTIARQSLVYSLSKGKLHLKENGVTQFEEQVNRKVAKLNL